MESNEADLTIIYLSHISGGPKNFKKVAKSCYRVNFEINVHNFTALCCAAEYLEMTDRFYKSNLTNHTDDFLSRVALLTFFGALVVLKCCEDMLPLAKDLNIVHRCMDLVSTKACSKANFLSRSLTNWLTEELSILDKLLKDIDPNSVNWYVDVYVLEKLPVKQSSTSLVQQQRLILVDEEYAWSHFGMFPIGAEETA
ncbi:hypothetical protein Sjap_017565 [Stephania japonica]|uniref:Uncharacterized protein n=1 Tax=Stephania japonica TaxID=461633 RepID=A0AAP0I6E9_9MAGN